MSAVPSPTPIPLQPAVPSPVWGWKMLAVVALANAAATLANSFWILSNPFALFWASVAILMAIGLAEYAFQKHVLPLAFWRFFAPGYAFYIASAMDKAFRPGSPVVIAICGTAFLVASIVAIARRARYLGPNRIPFGGRNPSLT